MKTELTKLHHRHSSLLLDRVALVRGVAGLSLNFPVDDLSVCLSVGRSARTYVGLSSALWKNGGSYPDAVWYRKSDGSRDEAGSGVCFFYEKSVAGTVALMASVVYSSLVHRYNEHRKRTAGSLTPYNGDQSMLSRHSRETMASSSDRRLSFSQSYSLHY